MEKEKKKIMNDTLTAIRIGCETIVDKNKKLNRIIKEALDVVNEYYVEYGLYNSNTINRVKEILERYKDV